jgi:hypothetical protein
MSLIVVANGRMAVEAPGNRVVDFRSAGIQVRYFDSDANAFPA